MGSVHGALLRAPKEKQTHSLCVAEADNKIVFEEGFSKGFLMDRKREEDKPW